MRDKGNSAGRKQRPLGECCVVLGKARSQRPSGQNWEAIEAGEGAPCSDPAHGSARLRAVPRGFPDPPSLNGGTQPEMLIKRMGS